MSVVFKDPRDVVIYEHMMRIDKKEKDIPELIPFIYERFEVNVRSWIPYVSVCLLFDCSARNTI